MKQGVYMKKIFLLLVLAGISTGAFASKARLEAFGEDKYGSLIFDHYRNIYLNMAAINDYKNFAIIEWGHDSNGVDSPTAPNGEGGMTFSSGNMIYGLHFGYSSDTIGLLRNSIFGFDGTTGKTATDAGAGGKNISANDVIDLMVGSEKGNMKWGAALQYSTSNDETGTDLDAKQSAGALRLGVSTKKFNFGAIISLANKAEYMVDTTTKAEFKGKLGLAFNGSYDLSKELRLFGQFQTIKAEGIGAVALSEISSNKIELGISKIYKFSETDFMFIKATINQDSKTLTLLATTKDGEQKDLYLPVTIGAEGLAKEWLKIRGSIAMVLYGSEDVTGDAITVTGLSTAGALNAMGKKSQMGTATVNAGATLLFGDLAIDGLIGTTDTAGTSSKDGVLALDNLMTRVSMTYNF